VHVSEPVARYLERGDLVRVRGTSVVGVHPPAARASLAAG